MFSALQNLTPWNEQKDIRYEEARGHVRFMMKLYKKQVDQGRLFLHEHPATATSWSLEEVRKVATHAGVDIITAD